MSEILALSHLMQTGRAADHPISFRGHLSIDFSAFAAETANWYAAFIRHGGSRFALYFEDSARFAAALFAAWHAGKCVYLPSDTLPSTLIRLREQVDGYASDLPGENSLLAEPESILPAWQPLDPDAEHLVIFTSGSSGEPSAIGKRLSQVFDEVSALAGCFQPLMQKATVLATVSHQHI